jgi:hypothetical protein
MIDISLLTPHSIISKNKEKALISISDLNPKNAS